MVRKFNFIISSIVTVLLFPACGNQQSSASLKQLNDIYEKYALEYQNIPRHGEEKWVMEARVEKAVWRELETVSAGFRGFTVAAESQIEGVEIAHPVEMTDFMVKLREQPHDELYIELMGQLNFTKEMTRQELTGTDNQYRSPNFVLIAYDGDEVIDVITPRQKWREPEQGYHENILKGTVVNLTIMLRTSLKEPHKYDKLTRFVVVTENSEILQNI